ncbi:MAG: UxaA family hydrolase [Planctomycetota bacterium]|nr:UxaA family hydrolase [Planctomycetota bacterium]
MTTSNNEQHALRLDAVGRLPAPGDNCAIAIRRLEPGTVIMHEGVTFKLAHTVLEGHRFVIAPIVIGTELTSWGLPFGRAVLPLQAGDYVCNTTMLAALRSRHVGFAVPETPNFVDNLQPYQLDEASFRPAEQMSLYATPRTFEGYARAGARGAGTRNHVVVLGTSSLTGSMARMVAAGFAGARERFSNVDGVAAIAHTEGGENGVPNNLDLTLRTLAGFITNPNVGAVLALDFGSEPVNNDSLTEWMRSHGAPLDAVSHRFMRLGSDHAENLTNARAAVEELLAIANQTPRTTQPIRYLKIGLQCGGSDAFSGVSGNPLAGIIARETVRHGGAANLAETDELMGAESWVLANVRDLDTARKFLKTLATFEEKLQWHGESGQTNPSGGNIFRGLYNIAIKSIGAARKKDPQMRLDWVIDYAESMPEPGFYFMNSPGNDLESIAGQVAAGCNLIVFSTGNGSITNHPFVPTIKVMTNSGRFNLLSRDMDLNAGRYLDGESMETLGEEAFNYAIAIASGRRSVGERAGHSQAQLWREWRQTANSAAKPKLDHVKPDGVPLAFKPMPAAPSLPLELRQSVASVNRVRLIIPTSLCAGQIARMIADKLNANLSETAARYVALPHTEGCGVSGEAIDILEQTIAGYAAHSLADRVLLLEHGCEKTHNDAIRNFLATRNIDHSAMGFASIQLDGGIERVMEKVMKWFASSPVGSSSGDGPQAETSDISLCLGMTAQGDLPGETATALASVAASILASGGSVILPETSPLLRSPEFTSALFFASPHNTLSYGEIIRQKGLHVMAMSGDHLIESLSGMGSSGANLFLVHEGAKPAQGHPFIPTVQIASDMANSTCDHCLVDVVASERAASILAALSRVWTGQNSPKAQISGNVDFQVSRGWFGVST